MPHTIPCHQVDAFTNRRFAGNPAAVCPLARFLSDQILQWIATENALSETAFLVRRGDGEYDLRWFTPRIEVDLCGHATLAAAFVVMTELEPGRTQVRFHSRSGALVVVRDGDLFTLDFPRDEPVPVAAIPGLVEAVGATGSVVAGRYPMLVLDSAHAVRGVRPDFRALMSLESQVVIVTAPGDGTDSDVDFVSRSFAPKAGIDEDPVTGSAHCTLVPYWAQRLGRTKLRARQVSARGGELHCELVPGRVLIGGNAVLVKTGSLILDDDDVLPSDLPSDLP